MTQFKDPVRQLPLKFQYNTFLDVKAADYLPVIGNEMPQKFITYFDVDDNNVGNSAGGTATVVAEYRKNKHAKSCTRVEINATGSASVSYAFPELFDFSVFNTRTNNYAYIKSTGDTANPASMPFFVLDFMSIMNNSGEATFTLTFYATVNGDIREARLKSDYTPIFKDDKNGMWYKMQWQVCSDYFNYVNGFTDDDWRNIERFNIDFFSGAATLQDIYIGGAWLSLPQYFSNLFNAYVNPDIANVYYPSVVDNTCIFVSQLFGDDDNNNGLERSVPYKTIEAGLQQVNTGRPNLVILDSEVYKPVDWSNYKIGISAQANAGAQVTIIADFLETPVMSCKEGVGNQDKIGAREFYRTQYYSVQGGVGTTHTVGLAGDYTTISAALTAASAGDCIEIIDSAIYDENIIIDRDITIQAAPQIIPTLKYAGGVTTLENQGHTVVLNGLVFEGNSGGVEKRIQITGTGWTRVFDCSFTKIGASGVNGRGADISASGNIFFDSCLFIDNGDNFEAIHRESGVGGVLQIKNCSALLHGNASQFVNAGASDSNTSSVNILLCSIFSDISGIPVLFRISDSVLPFGTQPTNINILGCYSEGLIDIDYGHAGFGGVGMPANTVHISNNYFLQPAVSFTLTYVFIITLFARANGDPHIYINGNTFTSSIPDSQGSSNGAISFGMSSLNTNYLAIENNIFYGEPFGGFMMALYLYTAMDYSPVSIKQNIFYGMGRDAAISAAIVSSLVGGSTGISILNNIFSNNWREFQDGSVVGTGTATILFDYNIFFGAAKTNIGMTITYGSHQIATDPAFTNAQNLNFSWSATSPIEKYNYWDTLCWTFINPYASFLWFRFIDIQGTYGKVGAESNGSYIMFVNCNLSGFLSAAQAKRGLAEMEMLDIYYSTINNNGFGVRNAAANAAYIIRALNNIISYNDIGVMLKAGCRLEYNTIIINGVGLAEYFTGISSQGGYISRYVVVKNNIIIKNTAVDYYGRLKTDYCIIFKRYFDTLAENNLQYINTKGENDVSSGTILDEITLFPATKTTGYIDNSPAYLSSSDGFNMGARHGDFIISSTFKSDAYTANSTGTVDEKGEFLALENPNHLKDMDVPMNANSVRTVRGDLLSNPTGYASEKVLSWGAGGVDGKITDAGREALRLMFMTYWIVGVSFDGGINYTYYKVDKNSAFSMEAQDFIFNNLQASGNLQIHLIEKPDFDLTEFIK